MEAAGSSKDFVPLYQTTWSHIMQKAGNLGHTCVEHVARYGCVCRLLLYEYVGSEGNPTSLRLRIAWKAFVCPHMNPYCFPSVT
jgi:hypothetical protein